MGYGDASESPLKPIPVLLASGPALISGGAGRIVYTSVLETSGSTPASFSLYDGAVATGRIIVDFAVAAGQSVRDQWPTHGMPFEGDLYIGGIAGVGRLIAHVCPEDAWDRWQAMYWRGFHQALLNAHDYVGAPL